MDNITMYARGMGDQIKVWSAQNTNNGSVYLTYGYFGYMLHTKITKATRRDEMGSLVLAKRRDGYKTIEEIANGYRETTYIPSVVTYEWLNKHMPAGNVDVDYNLLPMKCQPFKERKFEYPAIAQPKLNGIRGVMREETLTDGVGLFATEIPTITVRSKKGLRYNVPHITDIVPKSLFDKTFGTISLDGELYIHGKRLNEIKSAVPQLRDNGIVDNSSNPHLIPYITFCVFDLAVEDMPQSDRIVRLDIIKAILAENNITTIQVVPHVIVYNDAEVYELANKWVAEGYEGVVIRNMEAEYKFGSRPMTMMKLKFIKDGEFEILDVIPKPKEPETGIFILRNDTNDHTFECNPTGTFKERAEYLANKQNYIGKQALVRYRERSGVKEVPFHANVLTIRDYE